jgi:hypothetical protein
MDGQDSFQGFKFYNHTTFDNKIETQTRIEPEVAINNRQQDLPFGLTASLVKLVNQTGLVDTLDKTGPEGNMNSKGGIHDLAANPISFLWDGFPRRLGVSVFHEVPPRGD